MRLLLVRHGQTSSNLVHALDTAAPGADLTDLGRRQAEAIPDALAGEDVRAVFCSDRARAQQTAAPLARALGLEAQVRPGAAEISAGVYEMRNDEEAIDAYVRTAFGWLQDPDVALPGGESGTDVLTRFDSVVAEAHAQVGDGTACIVAHGAVIRVWAGARARNLDPSFPATHMLPNTSLVALEGDPSRGWALDSWGEAPLGGPQLDDPAHEGPAGEPA